MNIDDHNHNKNYYDFTRDNFFKHALSVDFSRKSM